MQIKIKAESSEKITFINIDISKIIDHNDSENMSLKRKIIKELHKIVFDKAEERLFYGKRVDFSSMDLLDKYKKRLSKLKIILFLSIIAAIAILVLFVWLAINFKEAGLITGMSIFVLLISNV